MKKKLNLALALYCAILALIAVTTLEGCKLFTPAQETQIVKEGGDIGGTILCVLEQYELDDPALNAMCGKLANNPDSGLTDEQRTVIQRHTAIRVERAKAMNEKMNSILLDGGTK